MFEYLIARDIDGREKMEIVGFEGLLNHIEKALGDDSYTFCAYEIHRIAIDFSLPREGVAEKGDR